MTHKIYELDGMAMDFTATVTESWEENGLFVCVLDRTAFFPGGGGQERDEGTLNGIRVVDLKEREDRVLHFTAEAIPVGTPVEGQLDKKLRFSRMQAHSGEHIVSGIVHSLFGYDNVGFHMGEDGITVDFSGELTEDDILRVELMANEAIYKNVAITAWFPLKDKLSSLEYRSKKEIEGAVRIVNVEGYDNCACCAPHVDVTGRIGIIKLLDHMRWRGGVRIRMLCGYEALADYNVKFFNNRSVAEALKVKHHETAAAFEKYIADVSDIKRELTETRKKLMALKADTMAPSAGNICIFEEGLSPEDMRNLCNMCVGKCGGILGVFSKTGDIWMYTLASEKIPLRSCISDINSGIYGKGGGSDSMITGRASASETEIKNFFETFSV